MRLWLSSACPLFSLENRHHFHAAFYSVAQGQNQIAIARSEGLVDSLMARGDGIYAEFVKKSVKRAIYGSSTGPDECGACSPTLLVEYLRSPLEIVVENATSDREFLLLQARVHRPDLHSVLQDRTRARFLNGGGLPVMRSQYADISNKAPYVRGLPRRVFTFFDSDAIEAGCPSREAKLTEAEAKKAGIQVRLLERRSIENYFPVEALEALAQTQPDLRERISRIISMPASQRHYFHFKKGSTGQGLAGIGDQVRALMVLCNRDSVLRDSIRRDDSRVELDILLDEIEELL